jgi:DNA-binding CsgD family transcriptional regulator
MIGALQQLPIEPLSEKQRRICELLGADQTDKEIAAIIGISESGVSYHLSELQWKLRKKTRAGIAAAYVRLELNKRLVGGGAATCTNVAA